MLETVISILGSVPPELVLLIALFVAFIEHIFPPSPSDIIMVFIGTLVGVGSVDFLSTLSAATMGSILGFMTAYTIGKRYGRKLLSSGWLPFITESLLQKVERWFHTYHDWIIVANRFLAGTRAVIAFFAGMSNKPLSKTLTLSALSAIAWNSILIGIGMWLGTNWKGAEKLLSTYGWFISIGIAVFVITYIVRRKRRKLTENNG